MITALLLTLAPLAVALPDDAVIALIMVDRFADGRTNRSDVVTPAQRPTSPRRWQGGDLAGVRQQLPYLHELGITHLWLTPLHEQIDHDVGGTAPYHGYWPQTFDAVDPHFGTVDDLRALVADAAALEMGVVLDVVTNHTGYGARDPLTLVRPTCGDDDTTACLFGLPDLKTEDPRVRAVIVDKTLWWPLQARLSGLRLDAFKHIDRDTAVALRAAIPVEVTLVAEQWGVTAGDAVVDDILREPKAADAVFDFGLMGLGREFVGGRMRSAAFLHHLIERDRHRDRGPALLPFLDNHDVETWTHAVGAARSPIGAAVLLSDAHAPVITWGTELLREGGAKDPDNRTFMPWERVPAMRADPSSSFHFWRRLIALRQRWPVLYRGVLSAVAADTDADHPRFAIWQRQSERERDRAVVAVALDRPLRHSETLPAGVDVKDVVGWHGTATQVGRQLVIDVAKDGAVVVVLQSQERSSP